MTDDAFYERRNMSHIHKDCKMTAKKPRLRFITYMCPSHPVELYELFMHYIEEEVGCEATLMYESRSSGPLTDRSDPYTDDLVDIGFMSSSSYVKLLDSKNKFAELLPVAAVFDHPKNNKGEKGYFADIIIHVDGRKHVKEFLDLRGCRWAYSDESSLSGNTIVLKTLKELGENASFFGNTLKSGSHLNSVQMVLTKQAEAAAVDANTLAYNKKYLQDGGKDILVLDSLGPLPPYPIVINSRLKDDMKKKLTQAFMKISDNKLWSSQLKKYGLSKFVPNCLEVYEMERDIQSAVKNMHLGPRYY